MARGASIVKQWTNAATLARLSGLSRQTIGNRLAKNEFPNAVRVLLGDLPQWRIPLKDAEKWLRAKGYVVPVWERRDASFGGGLQSEVWVAAAA
jgi:hypothetical protein